MLDDIKLFKSMNKYKNLDFENELGDCWKVTLTGIMIYIARNLNS